jgi:hypothetical protein
MSGPLSLPDLDTCRELAKASREPQGLPAGLSPAGADAVAQILYPSNNAIVTHPADTPSRSGARTQFDEVAR